MRRYETIFIVTPNVAEDEIEAITSKATSIIEGDGGTILRINNWGLKKLAYLIKKENQGYYVYTDYAGVPASVAEIERIFRIDDRILKYLTVKLSDSCDPEAVKEELAKAEPVPTSDEEGMGEEKDDKHKEQEKTDTVKEELTKAEPVPVSDKEVTGEGKDDEHEEQEEPDTVKEEQAD